MADHHSHQQSVISLVIITVNTYCIRTYFRKYTFSRIAGIAIRIFFCGSGRSNLQLFCVAARVSMSVTMFLMALGVQEMAVGRIQVAKPCQDKLSRVLNIAKN